MIEVSLQYKPIFAEEVSDNRSIRRWDSMASGSPSGSSPIIGMQLVLGIGSKSVTLDYEHPLFQAINQKISELDSPLERLRYDSSQHQLYIESTNGLVQTINANLDPLLP